MTQPLTPDALVYDAPLPADPQVSPDGARIVYTLAQADRATERWQRQIWSRASDGSDPRQVSTQGTHNNGARWSPDGDRIAWASGHEDGSALVVAPASGADEREITRHRYGIADLAWSPDGRSIAYVTTWDPDNPDEEDRPAPAAARVRVVRRLDYKDDGRGFIGDVRDHVFVVDVATGTRRRLTSDLVDHAAPTWSPDGSRIAIHQPSPSGWGSSALLVLELATGEWQRVNPPGGVVDGWAWSPDGRFILYSGDTRPTYQNDWLLYDVAAGATRRLTDDLACDPSGHPIWLDERRALFNAARAGATGLYLLDTESGAVEQVSSGYANTSQPSIDRAHRRVVQVYSSFERVRELAVTDLKGGETRIVTDYGAALLAERPPARWERIETRRGAHVIESWLLFPPDFDPTRRYPMILSVHGGPHGYYGYRFQTLPECLATHGYIVVMPNPRGSTSYGRAFTQGVIGDWMGEDYQDVIAAFDDALTRHYADPARTGIFGYSYGGHTVAWAIGQTQRFKAAVCGAPSFDLESQYGTSSGDWDYGDIGWGGPPWENRDWYLARSPSTWAHRARTPTLIIHGEEDQGCPIGQAEQLFVTLVKVGCEVEFARYPGEHHAFIDPGVGAPEHQVDYLARSLAWFQRYV